MNSKMMLVVDGRSVAPLRVADTSADRRQGLLGTDSLDGALWITRCPSVHTMGMRYPIDVAFLNRRGVIIDIVAPMKPGKLGWIRFRAAAVIEASAGSFADWGMAVGSSVTRLIS